MAEKRQRKIASKLRDENNVATAAIRLCDEDQGSRTVVPSAHGQSTSITPDNVDEWVMSISDDDGEVSTTTATIREKQRPKGTTKRSAAEHEHARKPKRTKKAPVATTNDSDAEVEEIEKPKESAEEERGK